MDADLRDAYLRGYASATNRAAGSRLISAASGAATPAVAASKLSSRVRQAAESDNMGFAALLGYLALFAWNSFAALVYLLGKLIVLPVLVLLAIVVVYKATVKTARPRRWLVHHGDEVRDRYDDVAMDSTFLRDTEHYWNSFKRAMNDLWLTLRWNWYTDQITLAWQEVGFAYDAVMSRWRMIALAMFFCYFTACELCKHFGVRPNVRYFNSGNLVQHMQSEEPSWVDTPRQWEASNSNYQRVSQQQQPVAHEQWVSAAGSDQSVSLEPSTMVVTITRVEHTTHTMSSIGETTVAETDYWAPLPGKTVLGSEPTWCRACQQYHCCELPY